MWQKFKTNICYFIEIIVVFLSLALPHCFQQCSNIMIFHGIVSLAHTCSAQTLCLLKLTLTGASTIHIWSMVHNQCIVNLLCTTVNMCTKLCSATMVGVSVRCAKCNHYCVITGQGSGPGPSTSNFIR